MTDPSGSTRGTAQTQQLEIERRILRARTAAMDALAQGNWDAVVLSCGKVLQEVARNELPYNEHGGTLPQLLERLARRLQTDQPVSDLAAALKDAGGLRGFFDLESDVDEELARATVSVIEAFLTYTYAFREEVNRLAELAASRREGSAEPASAEPVTHRPATEQTGPTMPAPTEATHGQGAGHGSRDAERGASSRTSTEAEVEAREEAPAPERRAPERRAPERREPEGRERADRDDRQPSAFDRFEDRKDDPIRQTWKPPRSKE